MIVGNIFGLVNMCQMFSSLLYLYVLFICIICNHNPHDYLNEIDFWRCAFELVTILA